MKRLWHIEPDLPIGAFRPVGKKMTLHGGGGGGFLKAILPIVATYFLGPAGMELSTPAAAAIGGGLGGALGGGGLEGAAKGGLLGFGGASLLGGLGGSSSLGGADPGFGGITSGTAAPGSFEAGLGGVTGGDPGSILGSGTQAGSFNAGLNSGASGSFGASLGGTLGGQSPSYGGQEPRGAAPTSAPSAPGATGSAGSNSAPGALGGVGDVISGGFNAAKNAYNSASPFTKDLVGGAVKLGVGALLSGSGSSKAFDPAEMGTPAAAPIAASPNSLGFGGLTVADSSKQQTDTTTPDPNSPSVKSYTPYAPRARRDTAGSGSYSGALAGGYS